MHNATRGPDCVARVRTQGDRGVKTACFVVTCGKVEIDDEDEDPPEGGD